MPKALAKLTAHLSKQKTVDAVDQIGLLGALFGDDDRASLPKATALRPSSSLSALNNKLLAVRPTTATSKVPLVSASRSSENLHRVVHLDGDVISSDRTTPAKHAVCRSWRKLSTSSSQFFNLRRLVSRSTTVESAKNGDVCNCISPSSRLAAAAASSPATSTTTTSGGTPRRATPATSWWHVQLADAHHLLQNIELFPTGPSLPSHFPPRNHVMKISPLHDSQSSRAPAPF